MNALLIALSAAAVLLCGSARAADETDVRALVAKLDSYIQKTGKQELLIDDLEFQNPVLSGNVSGIKFGDLSTASLRSGVQKVTTTNVSNVNVDHFNLNLGLDNFYILYNFSYSFLHRINGSGVARIEAAENSVNLVGTVAYGGGECQAHLESATITQVGKYKATIEPDTLYLAEVLQYLHNYVIKSDKDIFNQVISKNLQNSKFQAYFSGVICEGGEFK